MKSESVICGQPSHEPRVRVGLLATKSVIEVHHRKHNPQL